MWDTLDEISYIQSFSYFLTDAEYPITVDCYQCINAMFVINKIVKRLEMEAVLSTYCDMERIRSLSEEA